MRVMMLVKANEESEAGRLPSAQQFAEMGRFNDEMAKAGVLLSADGLRPSSDGARVVFAAGGHSVIAGPFPETEDLVAGYWVIEVASMDEATDWATRIPFREGVVELRPVMEAAELG
ncbi:YciI family protein [Streptomyces sp. NPDC052396]|uniref:YciI family protein n=1 Tax=Streptomyces sp. NPDC052396 TaxID=3365689 RepID=UPI0037D94481